MSKSSNLPAVEIAIRTDPGRDPDKQVNEDSSIQRETPLGLLAVVCDGMGGHAGGREASQLAIATIVEVVESAPPATGPGVALKRAIEEANARIWTMPTAEVGYRPGSTVVAVLLHEGGVEVAHVGDSRLYLVHAGAISQVTRDHSMVQELVDRNLIRAEDAASHPEANKILRALGIAKEVEVELRPEPLKYVMGDVLILCSDGLSDLVEPAEMLQIAGSHPPAQAVGQLVDLANARGGHDNITALVVRMKTSATVGDAPTLLKTIPLTAHPMPPSDPTGGPTGTVVSAPMATAPGMAPLSPASPGPNLPAAGPMPREPVGAVAIPPAPRSRTSMAGGRSHPVGLVIGIVLAVVALVIVGIVIVLTAHPDHRKTVPLVDDQPREAAVATEEDDAGPETEVVPAPPLDPPSKRLRLHDAGTGDPCAALRRAREHDASARSVERLEDRCRAAGGSP